MGDVAGGVKTVFADKDVIKLWDQQAGPMIRQMSEAEAAGDKAKRAILRRDFGRKFPGLNNDEAIKFYVRNEVFDAASAEKTFSDVTNVHYLLSGRLDGISFTRNAIATAKNQRLLSGGRAAYAYNLFNPTSSASAEKMTRSINELEKKGADVISILGKAGEEIDKGINPLIRDLSAIDNDIAKTQKLFRAVGVLMSRSPTGGGILIGDDAIKTIDNFRLTARLALPRDLADFATYYFLDSSADEQVVILRNLYATIMERYGLSGFPKGRALRDEILKKTFNNRSGMTTVANTVIPEDFVKEVSELALRRENNVAQLQSRGIIHPFQVAEMIAPLPIEQMIEIAATYGKKKNIFTLFDGATRNKYLSNLTDFWTVLTLAPRLGVRSAVDEAFMYALSAPLDDLYRFAKGSGRKLGKVATAFTGSKAAVGPVKRLSNKMFRKGGPEDFLSADERVKLIEEISRTKKIPVEEVTHMMIREETAERVLAIFGKDKSIDFEYLRDALVHHPDVLNAMGSSLAARTSLGGAFDQQIIDAIFTPSMLSKALEDVGVKTGRKFRALSTRELRNANEKWLTLAHYDAWYLQLVNNSRTLANKRVLDPATVFFSNDGLRTAQNFATARTDLLKAIGVEWDYATKQYVIKDAVSTKEF